MDQLLGSAAWVCVALALGVNLGVILMCILRMSRRDSGPINVRDNGGHKVEKGGNHK